MQVTKYLNVVKNNDVADIEIVGEIGYNFWADTYEDYKKNTSENIAKELNALNALDVKVINLTLESFGGDTSHALSIYNILKQSKAELNIFLRGANASASTIISQAAKTENIFMDNVGLFLVHKVMTESGGNVNDLQNTINDLNKWQMAINQVYLNNGVSQESLDDLMERNGGHGEWLTFNEAKEFGFVGKEWTTSKVTNYKKDDFFNRGYLVPKNIINHKTKTMSEITEETKKGLFAEFKNWIKGEEKEEALQTNFDNKVNELKISNDALEDAMAENETLKAKVAELEAKIAELEGGEAENVVENVAETMETIIENKVKEALKSTAEPITNKVVKNEASENEPTWKKHLNIHNKLK